MLLTYEVQEQIPIIEGNHGEGIFFTEKGAVTGINRRYFAMLVKLCYEPIYDLDEKQFYFYNPENGLWERLDNIQVNSKILDVIIEYCMQFNFPDGIGKCNGGLLSDIRDDLSSQVGHRNYFTSNDRTYCHCLNCMLELNDKEMRWEQKDFNRKYRSRNQIGIEYAKEAECPEFLNKLIYPAMNESDVELFKLYFGQSVKGYNSSQTILLMTGTPGGGKSTALKIVTDIIGNFNVTEFRSDHVDGRFETKRYVNKTMLVAADVRSDFLNTRGAAKLKALVGNDKMHIEGKLENNVCEIVGNYNVIISSNSSLQVKLDGDVDAWRRRLRLIKYDNPPPVEVIPDYAQKLIDKEGSGILNWALEGTIDLIKNNGKIPITQTQKKRIDDLLDESQSVNVFVEKCLKYSEGSTLTGAELLIAFTKYCKSRSWRILPDRKFKIEIRNALLDKFNIDKRNDIIRNDKAQRGYSGICLAST